MTTVLIVLVAVLLAVLAVVAYATELRPRLHARRTDRSSAG